jgi:hypothetical protein
MKDENGVTLFMSCVLLGSDDAYKCAFKRAVLHREKHGSCLKN